MTLPKRAQVGPPPTPIPLAPAANPVRQPAPPDLPEFRPSETLIAYSQLSTRLAGFLARRQNEQADLARAAGEAAGADGDRADVGRLVKMSEAWVASGGDRHLLPQFREGLVGADARKAAYARYNAFVNDPKAWGPLVQIEGDTGLLDAAPQVEEAMNKLFGADLPPSVQNEFGRREYASAASRYRDSILGFVNEKRGKALEVKLVDDLKDELKITLSKIDEDGVEVTRAAVEKWVTDKVYKSGVADPNRTALAMIQEWVDDQSVGGAAQGLRALRVADALSVHGVELQKNADFQEWAKAKRVSLANNESAEIEAQNRSHDVKSAQAGTEAYTGALKELGEVDKAGLDVAQAAMNIEAKLRANTDDPFVESRIAGLNRALDFVTGAGRDNPVTIDHQINQALRDGRGEVGAWAILNSARISTTDYERLSKVIQNRVDGSALAASAVSDIQSTLARSAGYLGSGAQNEVAAFAAEEQSKLERVAADMLLSGENPAIIKRKLAEMGVAAQDRVKAEAAKRDEAVKTFIETVNTKIAQGVDALDDIRDKRSMLTPEQFDRLLQKNTESQQDTRWVYGDGVRTAIGLATRKLDLSTEEGMDEYDAIVGRFRAGIAEFTRNNRHTMTPGEFANAHAAELDRLTSEISGAGSSATPKGPGGESPEGGGSKAERIAAGEGAQQAAKQVSLVASARSMIRGKDAVITAFANLYPVENATNLPRATAAQMALASAVKNGRTLPEARRAVRTELVGVIEDAQGPPSQEDLDVMAQMGAFSIDELMKGKVYIDRRQGSGKLDEIVRNQNAARVAAGESTQGRGYIVDVSKVKVNPMTTPLFNSPYEIDLWMTYRRPQLIQFLTANDSSEADLLVFKNAHMQMLKEVLKPY